MRTYLFPSLDSMSKYLSPERSFMPRGTFEQRRQVYDLVKAKNIAAETSPIFIQRTEDKIEIYLNACLCASLNYETEAVQLTAFGKQHFESQINAGQQPSSPHLLLIFCPWLPRLRLAGSTSVAGSACPFARSSRWMNSKGS